MRAVFAAAFATSIFTMAPATAMVGGAPEIPDTQSQPEVMFVGSGGNFRTGTMIVRHLVLTAAHCIHQGDSYKLVEAGPDRQPVFKDVTRSRADATLNVNGVRIGTAEIYRGLEKISDIKESVVISQRFGADCSFRRARSWDESQCRHGTNHQGTDCEGCDRTARSRENRSGRGYPEIAERKALRVSRARSGARPAFADDTWSPESGGSRIVPQFAELRSDRGSAGGSRGASAG